MSEFRVPLRWGDLDPLNHANNVAVIDFAEEARHWLVADGELAALSCPQRLEVSFLAPVALTRRVITIDSRVEGADVLQQVVSDLDGQRIEHARLRSGPASEAPSAAGPGGITLDVAVRRADVGPEGIVTPAQIAEIFQESRIATFWGERGTDGGRLGTFVVAGIEQIYAEPLPWTRTPVRITNRVTAIGTKSVSVLADMRLGESVIASTVMTLVAFDATTQTSRPITDDERLVLKAAC